MKGHTHERSSKQRGFDPGYLIGCVLTGLSLKDAQRGPFQKVCPSRRNPMSTDTKSAY